MTPQDVLTAAADLLEREGWTQGLGWTEAGCRCAWAAIIDAAGNSGALSRRAVDLLQLRIDGRSVVSWNDAPTRRLPEILAALRGNS